MNSSTYEPINSLTARLTVASSRCLEHLIIPANYSTVKTFRHFKKSAVQRKWACKENLWWRDSIEVMSGNSLKSLSEPFLMPGLDVILPTDAHSFPHRKQEGFYAPKSHLAFQASHLRLSWAPRPLRHSRYNISSYWMSCSTSLLIPYNNTP